MIYCITYAQAYHAIFDNHMDACDIVPIAELKYFKYFPLNYFRLFRNPCQLRLSFFWLSSRIGSVRPNVGVSLEIDSAVEDLN